MTWLNSLLTLLRVIFEKSVALAAIGFSYLAGKRRAENKQIKDIVEAKDAQLREAARPRPSRDELLERMRERD